jgi:hypothetical protein
MRSQVNESYLFGVEDHARRVPQRHIGKCVRLYHQFFYQLEVNVKLGVQVEIYICQRVVIEFDDMR